MNPDLQRRVQRYGWDKAVDYYEQGLEGTVSSGTGTTP